MMMSYFRRRYCWLALLLIVGSILPAFAAETAFPFDHELILDASPMRGSKRIPIIQISENGAASIDLWCASLQAQATVAADAITIVPGTAALDQCPPDRAERDEQLLSALSQVTNWRRKGDVVELIGAKNLRFLLMTN
jgi:heat shock protein HslJ